MNTPDDPNQGASFAATSDSAKDSSLETIGVPKLGLIVLCGASGSAKSTFARKHFMATEVVSSDHCRALVGDDESDQAVTAQAFALLDQIKEQRLELGRLTVIDATNVKPQDRKPYLDLARKWDVLATAIVFNLPIDVCFERNDARSDRKTPAHAIRRQHKAVRSAAKQLVKERFNRVYTISSETELETISVTRNKLWNDRSDDAGPFDIIGDVHGCHNELLQLLEKLGYVTTVAPIIHPPRAGV